MVNHNTQYKCMSMYYCVTVMQSKITLALVNEPRVIYVRLAARCNEKIKKCLLLVGAPCHIDGQTSVTPYP